MPFIRAAFVFLISLCTFPAHADSDQVMTLVNASKEYARKEDFVKAAELMTEVAVLIKPVAKEKYTHTLKAIAYLYSLVPEPQQTPAVLRQYEDTLIALLNDTKERIGTAEPAYALILRRIALIRSYLSDYSRAVPLAQQALTILEKANPGSADITTTKKTIEYIHRRATYEIGAHLKAAEKYSSRDKNATAAAELSNALAIIKQVGGKEHPAYNNVLRILANEYTLSAQIDKAGPLLLELRDIQKSNGTEHSDYLLTLWGIIQYYTNNRKMAEVQPVLHEALALTEKLHGKTHTQYAFLLVKLGVVRAYLGHRNEGIQLVERALFILEKEYPPGHEEIFFAKGALESLRRGDVLTE